MSAAPGAGTLEAAAAGCRRWSPNQRAKRAAIVEATVGLLLRDGVHGCTVRAIAAASGLSNGAVHYYFAEVEEIVDLAMADAVGRWVVWIRSADSADGPDGTDRRASATPAEVFWRTTSRCLEPFAQGDRRLLPLWLEYWAVCVRKGRLAPLRRLHQVLVSGLGETLAATGVDRVDERVLGVAAYLFGVSFLQPVEPAGPDAVRRQLGALSGLDAGAGR